MRKYQLQNGLTVVQETVPHSRSVAFGIWVKAGSRYEQAFNNGISHFIEHMMFKGTENFTAREIAERFDEIGGDLNAFTAKEYTCYYAKVLDEHLPVAIEIMADLYYRALFSDEELVKERNVVLEEIAMYRDTPDDFVHDLVVEAAYGNHPLAYPILGSERNLLLLESEHLFKHREQFYHLDHTVLSLAGNLDSRVQDWLEKAFGEVNHKGTAFETEPPLFLGGTKFFAKNTEQNHICLSFPGKSLADDQLYAMLLVNNAIGGGMSSRLFQEIREERGLAYAVYSYHSAFEDSGLLTIYTGTDPAQTEEVLQITLSILEEIELKGITELELKKGKAQLKGSLLLHLENTSGRMQRLGKDELMLRKHDTIAGTIAKIEAITLDDVRHVTENLLHNRWATALVGKTDRAIQTIGRTKSL